MRRVDWRWVAIGALILLPALAPLYLAGYDYRMTVVIGAFFYAIMASSWALLAGVAGQFSFAHMAFMGIGAYTSGLLGRDLGTTPLQGIVIGTLLTGVVGFIIGILCLRLRRAYLALFTIAFSEIVRIVVLTEHQWTEGSNGLHLDPLFPRAAHLANYYIMFGLLVGVLALMYALINSRFGLFFRALREDEEAAAALGVHTVRYKVAAFVITSLIAGLAGSVYFHIVGIITPNTMELLQMSTIIAMAVIGGIESLIGAAVGAFFIRIALESLRQIVLPFSIQLGPLVIGPRIELGFWRMAVFGVILMLTLRFAQNGLLYPIIDRLFLQRVREETVAKRKLPAEVRA